MNNFIKIKIENLFNKEIKSQFKAGLGEKSGKYKFFVSSPNTMYYNKYNFNKEALILSTGGSAFVHYYNGFFGVSTDCLVLSKKYKNSDLKYLYYKLFSKIDYLNFLYFEGSGLKHLSKNFLFSSEILLPKSLQEQEKIAKILSIVDETIEKTDNLIEKYKKIKTGLMEDLFTSGINVNTLKAHTKFKDSELGKIPESWEVEKIDNFIDFFTDYTANGSFESLNKNTNVLDEKNYAYYVRLYDIRLGVGHNKQKYVDKNTFNFLSKSYLRGGEILLANIGANVGETFLFKGDGNLATLAPNMILMRLNKNLGNFFYYYSKSYIGRKEIIKAISGSGQPKINKTDLKCVKIVKPSLIEQQKIAEILTEADSKIEKEKTYKTKLQQIKKGLMNDLLTGKVRVKY